MYLSQFKSRVQFLTQKISYQTFIVYCMFGGICTATALGCCCCCCCCCCFYCCCCCCSVFCLFVFVLVLVLGVGRPSGVDRPSLLAATRTTERGEVIVLVLVLVLVVVAVAVVVVVVVAFIFYVW
ncbi:unnamed protein product [Polarella glacialis]|uniref:Uncharacterized protein n=1 Tax=Polarella glacialis TaxID=89957 RepID=A0A813FR16_POLGL|nr:unnamed protein product [Polarella glacialis]